MEQATLDPLLSCAILAEHASTSTISITIVLLPMALYTQPKAIADDVF